MPKLLKIMRGRKSSSEVPVKKTASKSNMIFRRSAFVNLRSDKSQSSEPKGQLQTTILPTITFSLSEDEEGSDIILSPVSDIENQVQDTNGSCHNTIFTDSKTIVSEETETKEIAVGTEDNKTVTFTHLEIMRNELAHMMQLAEKDKEICNLRKANEDLQVSHDEAMEAKNQEIIKIREMLASVEAALSEVEGKFESANKEHTKIIEVLMKTQHQLYELKHSNSSSWMTPVWKFFDMN
jgi:chromosome segregation ATPase